MRSRCRQPGTSSQFQTCLRGHQMFQSIPRYKGWRTFAPAESFAKIGSISALLLPIIARVMESPIVNSLWACHIGSHQHEAIFCQDGVHNGVFA